MSHQAFEERGHGLNLPVFYRDSRYSQTGSDQTQSDGDGAPWIAWSLSDAILDGDDVRLDAAHQVAREREDITEREAVALTTRVGHLAVPNRDDAIGHDRMLALMVRYAYLFLYYAIILGADHS